MARRSVQVMAKEHSFKLMKAEAAANTKAAQAAVDGSSGSGGAKPNKRGGEGDANPGPKAKAKGKSKAAAKNKGKPEEKSTE